METNLIRKVKAASVQDGAGVRIRRGIGTPALKNLDPFLMLDHFGTENPEDYIAGFPNHPHRGFVTVTYMIDGHMQHRDSMGHEGNLGPGDVQWMKAASGIIHSEMPQQEDGAMRGFQLWLNLPAAEKMSAPAYQEFPAKRIPIADIDGGAVKVISGEYNGIIGPVQDSNTNVMFLHADLKPHAEFRCELSPSSHSAIYVFDGSLSIAAEQAQTHDVVVLPAGSPCNLSAGEAGSRFVLVSGNPIGEPIVQHGPFVMNTEDEIQAAIKDYQRGQLVR